MKITVIMGSPRKKDSFGICKLIEKEMTSTRSIEFEYIFLKDYRIEDCKGCDLCFQKGENLCPNKDDLDSIKEKLIHSDGIIFASPVYAYQVPAPLKRLIDRLSFLFHRQELVGIPALLVVTSDGGGHKEVSKYLKMTASGWGCSLVSEVQVISPMFFESKNKAAAWGYNANYYKKEIERIKKSSTLFMNLLANKTLHVPTFYDIFMFNCLRSKTFISQLDYAFWKRKNWLNSNYFYDVKIGFVKKVFGFILKKIISAMGKKLLSKSIAEYCV